MKTALLVCLVLLVGIGFGFFLGNPAAVHADRPQTKIVRVTRLHLAVDSAAVPVTGPVVGFTCSSNDDGTADCYIASQP